MKFKGTHIDESLIKKALGKALGMPSGSDLFTDPSKGLAICSIFSLMVHKKKSHLQTLHIKSRIIKKPELFLRV